MFSAVQSAVSEAIDPSAHRKVAWVMREAGVRKILADSTVGSLNKYLQPRDFVIARDVLDLSQTQFSLLDGRLRHLCSSVQLFCPSMADTLEATATALWPAPGRVLGHRHNVIATHNWGPRFSSRAEAGAYRILGGDAINQSIGPEASAAREIGACFVSAAFVVRYQDGASSGILTCYDDCQFVQGATTIGGKLVGCSVTQRLSIDWARPIAWHMGVPPLAVASNQIGNLII